MSKKQALAALNKRILKALKNDEDSIRFIESKEYWKNFSLKDMVGETWHDIPGYVGRYQVSNFARVKSLHQEFWNGNHYVSNRELILKQQTNHKGYLAVCLRIDGRPRTGLVHRLVGLVFHKNPKRKKQINHKKGIKKNNLPDELEWATNLENQRHAVGMGLKKPLFGEKHPRAILTDELVREIRISHKGNEGKKGFRKALIEKYGVGEPTMKDILKGKTWKHVIV